MKPMLPKEHGAWGMVMLPAVAGLAVAGFGSAAGWLALAMVFFAYLLRAPLEALAKGRREASTWRWLAGYGAVTGLAAAGLVFGFDRLAWLTAAVWVLPAALVTVLFAALKRNRDVVNELAGAVALPVGGAVVYAAGRDVCDATALGLWLSFALYNALSVPYVRTWVMARRAQKNETYRVAETAARRWAWQGLGLTMALVAGQVSTAAAPGGSWSAGCPPGRESRSACVWRVSARCPSKPWAGSRWPAPRRFRSSWPSSTAREGTDDRWPGN